MKNWRLTADPAEGWGYFRNDLCHVQPAEDGGKWRAVIFLVQHVPASRVSKAQGSRSPSNCAQSFRIPRAVFPDCVQFFRSMLSLTNQGSWWQQQENRSKWQQVQQSLSRKRPNLSNNNGKQHKKDKEKSKKGGKSRGRSNRMIDADEIEDRFYDYADRI